MIDVGKIRAAANAEPGDAVGLSKAQLATLLDEIELGQEARTLLAKMRGRRRRAGTGGVSGSRAAA